MSYLTYKFESDGSVTVSGGPSSTSQATQTDTNVLIRAMECAEAESSPDLTALTGFSDKVIEGCREWLASQKEAYANGERSMATLAKLQLKEQVLYRDGVHPGTSTLSAADALTMVMIQDLETIPSPLLNLIVADEEFLESLDAEEAMRTMREYHPLAKALLDPLMRTAAVKSHLIQTATLQAATKLNDFVLELYDSLDYSTIFTEQRESYKQVAAMMKAHADVRRTKNALAGVLLRDGRSDVFGHPELHIQAQAMSLVALKTALSNLSLGRSEDGSVAGLETASAVLESLCSAT